MVEPLHFYPTRSLNLCSELYFFQKKNKMPVNLFRQDLLCICKLTEKNSTTNKKRYERKLVLFVYTLSNILFSF